LLLLRLELSLLLSLLLPLPLSLLPALLLLLLELLLLLLLELLGPGSLLRGDSLGGLGLSDLGLSDRGLSGVGFRSSCAFEMVEAEAPNNSAAANVRQPALTFSSFDCMWSPPAGVASKNNFAAMFRPREEFELVGL
jgi:hypothetical protein